MPQRKKAVSTAQKTPAKHLTFDLTLSGVAGIALATFCLFLWMFFLGIWAGRTIISPCPTLPIIQEMKKVSQEDTVSTQLEEDPTAICVQPRERKKRISPREPSLYQGP